MITKKKEISKLGIPTAICPICGRKYEGWELVYIEEKCCGKALKVKK